MIQSHRQSAEGKLLQEILARLGVGTIFTDAVGRIEYVSPFVERLTGWSTAEARGRAVAEVFPLESAADGNASDAAPALLRAPGPGTGVDRSHLVARDGHRFAVEHTATARHDGQGNVTGFVIAFHDVSEATFAALQRARQATCDPLTGLLNRQAFTAELDRALAKAGAGRPCALFHLDLDQFELVNHACGPVAGDELLQWVAALLREETRESDVVSRLGGDVFGLLLNGARPDEARAIAESILQRMQEFQYTWEDKSFPVSACFGMVPVSVGTYNSPHVLSAADHACSIAKKHGRGQLHICQLADEEFSRRQRELEWVAHIKRNLQEGGMCLFAQPIRVLSGAADGLRFEILLRTTGDEGGPKTASPIIQAAERYGVMATIDRWVIRTTLQALKAGGRRAVNDLKLCAINISGESLRDRTILEYINRQLSLSQVPPNKICFEVTETAAIENLSQACWLLEELQSVGCRFALDDFGSGLASYAHLKELPVSYLKIAGSFVENLATNALSRAMVESINQIGHVLGIETIAEAVSSEAAFDAVRAIGVTYGQGNWLAPPAPLAEVYACI